MSKTKQIYDTDKATFSQLVRWITGFNGLAYFNHTIGLAESANCKHCESCLEETAEHIIRFCQGFNQHRRESFYTIYDLEDLEHIDINKLKSFLRQKKVRLAEEINELPLLFAEDYSQINHDILESFNNASSSPHMYQQHDGNGGYTGQQQQAQGARGLDRTGVG